MFKVNIDGLGNFVEDFSVLRYLREKEWSSFEDALNEVMSSVREDNPHVDIDVIWGFNDDGDCAISLHQQETDIYNDFRAHGFYILKR